MIWKMLGQLDWVAASCSRSTLSGAAMATLTVGRPPVVLPGGHLAGNPEGTFTQAQEKGPPVGALTSNLLPSSAYLGRERYRR